MAFRRLEAIRRLSRTFGVRESSLVGTSRNYASVSNDLKYWRVSSELSKDQSANLSDYRMHRSTCRGITSCLYKPNYGHHCNSWRTEELRSTTAAELHLCMGDTRSFSTKVKAPPQARQMGAITISMRSPGIIYEPYMARKKVPFWRRWFTKEGWKKTKEDIMMELKSAYAIAKLRKTGYSKQKFYKEALQMYKEINNQIATGDKASLRKSVTEKMYSGLKNEIKQREEMWKQAYWELIEPVVKMRTLRARLIGVDPKDHSKVFIQLTLEFLTKQRFEAYDSKGAVVAGDKSKELLVKDIWVFEKSLFQPGAYWRLCGRVKL